MQPQKYLRQLVDGMVSSEVTTRSRAIGAFHSECKTIFERDVLKDRAAHARAANDILRKSPKGTFETREAIAIINDVSRTYWMVKAVVDACREGVHKGIDAGAGSGLLALAAIAQDGVDEMVAIESFDPSAQLIRKVADHFGYGDQIHVIPDDATCCELPCSDYDLLVSETICPGALDETILQIMQNLRRFLRKGAKFVPEKFLFRLICLMEVKPVMCLLLNLISVRLKVM